MELGITTTATVTNPDLGDLRLGDDGDEVVLTDMPSETHQRLWVRLQFFQGEWFRDVLAGTPYFQHIFKKAPRDRLVRAVFAQIINETEGVQRLIQFGYSINRAREMALTFQARLQDGSTFRSTDYPPFQVSLS